MSLVRQIGGIASANMIFLLCQLGVLSFLTQLTNVETVAQWGLLMAILQPLFMLSRMGLRANLATDAKGEHTFQTFLALRMIMCVVLVLVFLGIVTVFYGMEYLLLAVPLAIGKSLEMLGDICYGAMQRAEKIRFVARSLILRGVIALGLFGGVLYVTRSAEIAFWVQAGVWGFVQLVHDFPVVRRLGEAIRPDLSWAALVRLARNTAPLGLGHFFSALQISIPRLLVEAFLSVTALAHLTAVSYLQRSAISLFQSIEQTVGPRLSRFWADGKRGRFFGLLRKMMLASVVLGSLGCAAAVLLGELFLGLMFGPEYVDAATLLNWVALAIALRLLSTVMQTALSAQRRFMAFGKLQTAILIVTPPIAYGGLHFAGLDGVGMALAALAGLRLAIISVLVIRS